MAIHVELLSFHYRRISHPIVVSRCRSTCLTRLVADKGVLLLELFSIHSLVSDDLIEHHMAVPLVINLSKQVLSNGVCGQGGLVPIGELHFVYTSIEDWIVVCRPNWEATLVPKLFDNPTDFYLSSTTGQASSMFR